MCELLIRKRVFTLTNQAKVDAIRSFIASTVIKDKWRAGVVEYAFELIDTIANAERFPETPEELEAIALRGAKDWRAYSFSGYALTDNKEIATRLCAAGTLRRTRDGQYPPAEGESWRGYQARALIQAFALVKRAWHSIYSN